MRRRFVLATLPLMASPAVRATPPRTWEVGTAGGLATLAAALRLAHDGDTVALAPGVHRGGGVVTQARLTLVGLGDGAVLDGTAAPLPEGKALLVARGGDLRVENLVFRGARAPDGNGAGIRLERGRMHGERCRFDDNEMGLLTGNEGETRLVLERCHFTQAPPDTGRGLHHLLYIGAIAHARVSGCRFQFGSRGGQGHLLKCRAREAEVSDCELGWDDPQGTASYELDFPNGGQVLLQGNRIAQASTSPNRTVVAFGAEARPQGGRSHRLRMEGNTFRNEGAEARWWRVWTDRLGASVAVEASGNRFQGKGRAET